jgi:hypothetical protein
MGILFFGSCLINPGFLSICDLRPQNGDFSAWQIVEVVWQNWNSWRF